MKRPALYVALVLSFASSSCSATSLRSAPQDGKRKVLACLGWKKTLNCLPSGPRDIANDKACDAFIGADEAGFCECEGSIHAGAVPCSPVARERFTCAQKCSEIQGNYRWLYQGPAVNDMSKERAAINKVLGADIDFHYSEAIEAARIAAGSVGKLAVPNSPTYSNPYTKAGQAAAGPSSPHASGSPGTPGSASGWNELADLGSQLESMGKAAQGIGSGPALRPFSQVSLLEAAPKKVDLSKPMPLKAQEQGFSGKPVQHKNMKTHTADWRREYGPKTAPKATQHSGSMQCSAASAAVIIAAAMLHFAQ